MIIHCFHSFLRHLLYFSIVLVIFGSNPTEHFTQNQIYLKFIDRCALLIISVSDTRIKTIDFEIQNETHHYKIRTGKSFALPYLFQSEKNAIRVSSPKLFSTFSSNQKTMLKQTVFWVVTRNEIVQTFSAAN